LFADQALPSAGVSGSLWWRRAAHTRHARQRATPVLIIASYHIAYVVALGLALPFLTLHASALIVVASVPFVAFAVSITAAIALLSEDRGAPANAVNVRPLRGLVEFMAAADPALA
jgi:hypothetical protein